MYWYIRIQVHLIYQFLLQKHTTLKDITQKKVSIALPGLELAIKLTSLLKIPTYQEYVTNIDW